MADVTFFEPVSLMLRSSISVFFPSKTHDARTSFSILSTIELECVVYSAASATLYYDLPGRFTTAMLSWEIVGLFILQTQLAQMQKKRGWVF